MGNIVITKEMVESARAYVPIAEKEQFLQGTSRLCLDRLEMAGESGTALPPMYKENPMVKARCLMSAFAKLYLAQEIEEEIPGIMSKDAYDEWAGSHVFGQMERMKKSDPAVRNKVFDLLDDYADLSKRLNIEIYGLLTALNDPVARLLDSIATTATPEYMQSLTEQLAKAQKDIEDYAANRERIMAEAMASDEEGDNGADRTV